MIDLTPIVNAAITLAALLITTFLIPWIRTQISSEKLEQVKKWTSVGVKAAEMIYRESGMGEAKNILSRRGGRCEFQQSFQAVSVCQRQRRQHHV